MQRRTFLHTAGLAAAAAPQILRGQQPKLKVGVLGVGRRGRDILQAAVKSPDTEAVAISEIYKPNIDKALKIAPGAKVYHDFRDLLADKSIDIVGIGTPDHWHAYMTVEACKAGKDVYVEKPISVTVYEGQMMVKAARKYERIVQVGTQQRSGDHFQQVVKMIRNDEIGDIAFVRTWNYGNQYPEGIGNPPDSAPPEGLDWEMWLGPAPERPFNANRFGVNDESFSHFRWFWDYAGGMMTDWGIHLLDIVLWAMQEPGPTAVTAIGEKYVLNDNRETPDTILASYEFPGFAAIYENRTTNSQSMFDQGYGITFHGTKGTLFCDRSRWEILPEKEKTATGTRDRMAGGAGKAGNESTMDHWADFVSSIRTRKPPVADILEGHRSTTTALLGIIAMRSKQRVDWDPLNETTTNAEARSFLRREYRAPWKLEL
jgi:predicted dehydrogenase